MDKPAPKKNYKIISLFIKTSILILSFLYIYYKVKNDFFQLDFLLMLEHIDVYLLLIVFCLLFLNWGIEALKWKLLVSSLERISFLSALKAVFAGVTVSIFMPNRVGEFVGRVFFLENADKIKATLKNFLGSFMQLFVTLLIGSFSFYIVSFQKQISIQFLDPIYLRIIWFLFLISLLFFYFVLRFKKNFSEKINSYIEVVSNTSKKELVAVFLLSLFRYFVFVTQYFLILKAFDIPLDFKLGFLLIAILFVITSLVPSFAFTEIITRAAAAVLVFACVTDNETVIVSASFIIWIINLAIPALIGSIFVWQLKFVKQ